MSARAILIALAALGVAGAAGLWAATAPRPLPEDAVAGLEGDAARGESVFWAAGCASCHAPEDAEGEDWLVLSGGRSFDSPFGSFTAPNISTDPEHGIGDWTLHEFANAMLRGISPDGVHYYPAFPYASYIRADLQDVADLKAFMDTLPAARDASAPHDLPFPVTIRRAVGIWKRLNLDDDWVVTGDLDAREQRGRYLSEALAHCAECHTPRDAFGGLDTAQWLAGAPDPAGDGTIPDITPTGLDWSEREIAGYLMTGFTPQFDSAGGSMADVVHSLSHLADEDREAIAAYLKRVPPAP